METLKTIYHLVIQDAGRDMIPFEEFISSSPFPRLEKGDMINLANHEPRTWDVLQVSTGIRRNKDDGEIHITTGLVVNTPVTRPN